MSEIPPLPDRDDYFHAAVSVALAIQTEGIARVVDARDRELRARNMGATQRYLDEVKIADDSLAVPRHGRDQGARLLYRHAAAVLSSLLLERAHGSYLSVPDAISPVTLAVGGMRLHLAGPTEYPPAFFDEEPLRDIGRRGLAHLGEDATQIVLGWPELVDATHDRQQAMDVVDFSHLIGIVTQGARVAHETELAHRGNMVLAHLEESIRE